MGHAVGNSTFQLIARAESEAFPRGGR
jgi:hypothetical protein